MKRQRNKSQKCNCKQSKCLKLYCECFSAQRLCKDCNCKDCGNTNEENFKQKKRKLITKCSCKQSKCLKFYCECFASNITFNIRCKTFTIKF